MQYAASGGENRQDSMTVRSSRPNMFMSLSGLLIAVCVLFASPGVQAQGDDLLPAVSGAAKPSNKPLSRQPEDPETLYNRGIRQLRRGYYDEAIISFEKVKNHFPFNQYSVLSELRVADALFEKASYLEAIDAYRQFTRLHPRHVEIDYATYRMARAEFKVSSTVPQRDQTSTERGLKKLRGFEKRFPDSEYSEEVVRIRSKARTRLAKRVLQVGHFYWKSGEWQAAERRYGLVWHDYSDTPVIYRARYRQGLCLYRLSRAEEARVVLSELAAQPESGRWGERAERFLAKLDPAAEDVAAEPGKQEEQPDEPIPDEAAPVAEEESPSEDAEAQPEKPEQADQEKLSTGN